MKKFACLFFIFFGVCDFSFALKPCSEFCASGCLQHERSLGRVLEEARLSLDGVSRCYCNYRTGVPVNFPIQGECVKDTIQPESRASWK